MIIFLIAAICFLYLVALFLGIIIYLVVKVWRHFRPRESEDKYVARLLAQLEEYDRL